jgi:NAD-dependent deacetylase
MKNQLNKFLRKFKKKLEDKKNNFDKNSKPKLVILTGAGISQESGIKTFRDADGLWENHSVEDIASVNAIKNNSKLVFDFYNARRKDILATKPNEAHYILAELEEYYDVVIVTQNIDDLHERAGSTNVIHLHGFINEKRSYSNPQYVYSMEKEDIFDLSERCPETNSILRPNVVFFGEPVPKFLESKRSLYEVDIFIVIGTSLQVYPSADLALYVPKKVPQYLIDLNITAITKEKHKHYNFVEKKATT